MFSPPHREISRDTSCYANHALPPLGSMKDVIDVMQLQQAKGREHPPVKYKDRMTNFSGARFIFECGEFSFCQSSQMAV